MANCGGWFWHLRFLRHRLGTHRPKWKFMRSWHCGDDYCVWATPESFSTFDYQNRWMIDRHMDGTYEPSVNLVVFPFVDPLKLMHLTTDSNDTNGIPNGMDTTAISYFTSHGVRVMFSIGGHKYTSNWDTALSTNPTQLGINAANAAMQFNVGMEIDYENGLSPNINGLAAFVSAYRSVVPYDATGNNPAAGLTIDLGAGDQSLSVIASYAGYHWLTDSVNGNRVLDYANALVDQVKTKVSKYESDWLEHIDGYPSLNVPPLAPAELTGSFYLESHQPIPNCVGPFSQSQQAADANFIETVKPAAAGTTSGMAGVMFWAAGNLGSTTFPPNTCQNGMGVAATQFNIPNPMPALRQY